MPGDGNLVRYSNVPSPIGVGCPCSKNSRSWLTMNAWNSFSWTIENALTRRSFQGS